MLYRIFRSDSPALLILIPVVAFLVWFRSVALLQDFAIPDEAGQMPLYELLFGWAGRYPLVSRLTALGLLVAQAIWLAAINTRHIILKTRTYLPSFLFILISSCYLPLQRFHPLLIANLSLIYALEKLFSAHRKKRLDYGFFEAAFVISLAALLYSKAIFFLLILFAGHFLLRPAHFREWIFIILGFLLPWFFLFSYYYLTERETGLLFEKIVSGLSFSRDFPELGRYHYFYLGYLLLLIFISSVHMIITIQTLKIYIRKYFQVFFRVFVILNLLFFGFYSGSIELLIPAAIPVSFLISHYLISTGNKFKNELILDIQAILLLLLIFFNV